MKTRLALLLVALSLSTSGCAECFLHTLDSLFPGAYSGEGTIDQAIDEQQRLRELYGDQS